MVARHITFARATHDADGTVVAVGALRLLDPTHGERQSIHVA
jgi:hypothetical protein